MEWEIYPTPVQSNLGLMLVNLSYLNEGKVGDWPYLNWIRVLYDADSQGFPTQAEQLELEEISDGITEQLGPRGAIVGRLSVDGRREFFVYSDEPCADEIMAVLQERFPARRFTRRASEDPEWDVYFGFLCPDAVQLQRLASHKGMQALQEQGDITNIPRPVVHAAAFTDESAAEEFGLFLEAIGFEITTQEEVENEEAMRPFVIKCVGEHPVDVVGIERFVMPLFQKARELGGEYGGWQCSAVIVS